MKHEVSKGAYVKTMAKDWYVSGRRGGMVERPEEKYSEI